MATFSLAYAQEHLADLLERAGQGEEVVVANDRGITVRMEPVAGATQMGGRRGFGAYPELREIPDSVWAPLADDEMEAWERPVA